MSATTTRSLYRADHVGSLLRPAAVKAARHAHFEGGTLDAAGLREAEDEAITAAIALQEDVGLPLVTDGEYRRAFWHYDFLDGLTGLDIVERGEGFAFNGINMVAKVPTITAPLSFPDDHPMLDHFSFVADTARVAQAKISIPGPSACHFRTAPDDVTPDEYDDLERLFADVADTYAAAIAAFYDRGCRFLQLDDIFFAYLCDPKHRADKQAEGVDPDWLIGAYADMTERAIAGRPDDLTIGMHLCRGNFRSTWAAEGAYDPAADAIFNRTSVDVYFMEYDSDRAGGLEPLRLLPRGPKRVMPGFITTKTAELESVADLQRRFEQAAEFCDIGQLGIAPQCGFASTEDGNEVTEADQRAKLELVVETATAVWGGVTG